MEARTSNRALVSAASLNHSSVAVTSPRIALVDNSKDHTVAVVDSVTWHSSSWEAAQAARKASMAVNSRDRTAAAAAVALAAWAHLPVVCWVAMARRMVAGQILTATPQTTRPVDHTTELRLQHHTKRHTARRPDSHLRAFPTMRLGSSSTVRSKDSMAHRNTARPHPASKAMVSSNLSTDSKHPAILVRLAGTELLTASSPRLITNMDHNSNSTRRLHL